MSLSFGSSKKKTSSSQQSDPWEPTIASLEQLIGQIGDYQDNVGATAGQSNAFAELLANASEGNPFAGQISDLAGDLFGGVSSRAPQIEQAFNTLQGQVGDIAAGNKLDVNENPYIQTMLQQNADNIAQRINAQFAGAGRDLSGKNQESLARGISEGTVPALFNQYNLERQNQANAANLLFGAGSGAATAEQGLDLAALNNRLQGIPASQAAIDAENYGPNTILALEQQLKQLPIEDLGRLEALLGPLAQLGMQQSGKSTTKGSSTGLGVDNLFGGLGSLLSGLSDERTKEGEEKVGELADGTPIYKFSYKADPTHTKHIGVMAQDVEQTNPAAVAEVGGVKFVDYDAATKPAARKLRQRQARKTGGY